MQNDQITARDRGQIALADARSAIEQLTVWLDELEGLCEAKPENWGVVGVAVQLNLKLQELIPQE